MSTVRTLLQCLGRSSLMPAAARHGRQLVVIPAENASELGRLTEIASGLDIHPVRSLKEAVDLVLVDPQARRFDG